MEMCIAFLESCSSLKCKSDIFSHKDQYLMLLVFKRCLSQKNKSVYAVDIKYLLGHAKIFFIINLLRMEQQELCSALI